MKILLSVLLSLLISSAAMSQVCPNSVTLRMDDSECPIGATCTGKGAPLTLLEHDRNLANVAAICLWADGVTGGSGTSVILDLADDGTNESTAIAEIAVTNDTRSAFTEPSADKLLIDVNKIRMPSLLNPRVTPHAYDCEFDSGLCSGWSWLNTPPGGSGTVNPVGTVGSAIYDSASWPGWMLLQSPEGTGGYHPQYSISDPDGDWTLWAHVLMSDLSGGGTSNGERRVGFGLANTSDTNETIGCSFNTNSSNVYKIQLLVQNNGSYTSSESQTLQDGQFLDSVLVLWKDDNGASDDYRCGVYSPSGGSFIVDTKVTKTGTVAFDTLFVYLAGDNSTPSPVVGIDYIRFAASLKLPEMN